MLNKLLLNNQIITNKKKIQQARVQTINKLVQKLRKLKQLSTKYPDKANIKANLEKIPLILDAAKKLKAADIIRKVLTLTKKPAAVLTNGQAKPEDVAVALLATNKIISDITSALVVTLHLNDSNPGWRDEIMELSKKKKFLLKNAERKKQRKGSISKNPSPKAKPSWKEENVEADSAENSKPSEEVAHRNGWKVEPVENVLESTKTSKPLPRKEPKKPPPKILAPEENDSPSEETSPIVQKPVRTVDSFFFTTSGDNYMSSVIMREKQPDGPDDGLDRRERRQNDRRSHQNGDRRMRPSFNNRRNDQRQDTPWTREKPQQKQRDFKNNSWTKEKPQQKTQDLHPSWSAKQKMNAAPVEFKGRKIKFDDDSTPRSQGEPSEKRPKKSHPPAQSTDAENLHPSWAAKQKLKPTITEFKGTKITFDD